MNSNVVPAPRREAARSDLLERRLRRYHPRFQGAVRALATRHTRIADLAASFPALLFALAVPRPRQDTAPALARVLDGAPLAEVAAAAGVALWLRRLPPESFAQPIPRLPDGALVRRQILNHLPRSPRRVLAWLQVVADMAELSHEQGAVWIAREMMRAPLRVNPKRLRLLGLWIWFSGQTTAFGHGLIDKSWSPAMGIDAALAAANDWRTEIALHVNLGAESIADMWLQAGHAAGYDFLPLDSIASIASEAKAMKNCLRTYGYNLAHNRSRLWSVRRDGARVATLRVAIRWKDPLLNVVELEAADNTRAPREVWWAARQWLQTHDLSAVDTGVREWGRVPLVRATWLSLWRPYWLAKRRVPDWLPIAPSRDALEAL